MSEEIEKNDGINEKKVYKVGDKISLVSDGSSVYEDVSPFYAPGHQVLEVEVKSAKTARVVFE
jgi:hypothetical protein